MVTIADIEKKIVQERYFRTERTTFCELEFENGWVCAGFSIRQTGTPSDEAKGGKEVARADAIDRAFIGFTFNDMEK